MASSSCCSKDSASAVAIDARGWDEFRKCSVEMHVFQGTLATTSPLRISCGLRGHDFNPGRRSLQMRRTVGVHTKAHLKRKDSTPLPDGVEPIVPLHAFRQKLSMKLHREHKSHM